MPQPEGKPLEIDVYLTNLAVGILPTIADLQGRRLFTNIPMASKIGKYPRYDDFGDWSRVEGKELANREAPPTAGFGKPTTELVEARKWGVHTDWTDDDLAEADVFAGEMAGVQGFQDDGAAAYELKKVEYVTRMAALRHEMDVIKLVRETNWGVKLQGTNDGDPAGSTTGNGAGFTGSFLQWDDDAAEPIKLMKRLIRTMQFHTGKKPNVAGIPGTVLDVLFEHPQFLDRVIGGANVDRPAAVNLTLLANMLGIEEIIELGTVINTSKEGQAPNFEWAWGYDVWIGYRPTGGSVDREAPAPAYNFTWTGRNGGARPTPFQIAANNEGIFINRYNLQKPATYNAESYLYTAPRVVARQMGIILKDVIPASAAPLLGVGTYRD